MACRLHIKICEAQKVLKMDLGGKSDPYVTLKLKSQDKKDVQKTQVISNTTNPIWNQEFDIVANDPNDSLLINMFDEDIKNDDKMMDELSYPVNTWQIGAPVDRKEVDLKLKKKKAGKLIFEVQAFPAEGVAAVSERAVDLEGTTATEGMRLHIKAFDAKDVLKMDLGGKSDPYLRFRLKGKKESTKKTQIISNTRNPVWNQELDVVSKDRQTDILEVDMFDEDIKNDDKMMDRISIPLREHNYGEHYVFDNEINLKKKKAGRLHFEIDFLPENGEPAVQTRDVQLEQPAGQPCKVRVHAIKGENLLKMDANASDPYVRLQIKGQPDYTQQRTKTVDNNLNPVWDQTYDLVCNDWNTDVLLVDLYDEDLVNDDQMMDQLAFPINQWPIGTHVDYNDNIKYKGKDAGRLYLGIDVIDVNTPIVQNRDIVLEEPAGDYCPFTLEGYGSSYSTDFTGYTDWSHSLSPLNSADEKRHHHHGIQKKTEVKTREITLDQSKPNKVGEIVKGTIIKANGLPKTDSDGSDTYVVLTVITKEGDKDKKGEKVKTDIIHDTQDPEWNYDFELPTAKKTDIIRAKVWQYHKVVGDQIVAQVDININDLRPDEPLEQTFPLDKPPKAIKIGKKEYGTITLRLVLASVYQ